jgi:uncharacterized membrane protein
MRWKSIEGLAVLAPASALVFQIKLGVVLVTLARGLLDFIWAIRQMNYCLAAIGATPMWAPRAVLEEYAEAPAHPQPGPVGLQRRGARLLFRPGGGGLAAGSHRLRGGATGGAMILLLWRQRRSPASAAVRKVRQILERQPVVTART